METTPKTNIVTRFAPSPTGFLHAGTYRTAIFSYLFARRNGGKFFLRIEDTDRERSKKEFEDNILDCFSWFGLEYDQFFRQSENVDRHKQVLLALIKNDHAYISKEEAKDGSGAIKEIVRFRNPNIDITFHDEIRGDITMHTGDLGDFVIAKSITEPLFHLAVVVDDADEGVTHVIRGDDHVSNTPRQILLQRAIGIPTPTYAHLPLVLGTDRQKLSKRRGALALTEYRAQGYLPEALLNMISLVGWNPGTEQELFSKNELIQLFDLHRVQHSSAIFNPEKLEWINKEYIRKLAESEQLNFCINFLTEKTTSLPNYSPTMLQKILPLIIDRINHFGEIRHMEESGELEYFFVMPKYSQKEDLLWKKLRNDETGIAKTITLLSHVHDTFTNYNEKWSRENLKDLLWEYAEKEGRGEVLWPTRYALSGREKSPDPFELSEILGKHETILRIAHAIDFLQT